MEFLFRIVPHSVTTDKFFQLLVKSPLASTWIFGASFYILWTIPDDKRVWRRTQLFLILLALGADYIRFPTLDCVVRTRPHDRVPVALPTALARSWNRRLLPESCHARLHDGGHGSLAASQRHQHGAGNSRVTLDRDPKNLGGRTLSNRHPCFASMGGCSACSMQSGNARTQRGSRAG